MKYLKVFTDFAKDIEILNDAEVGRLFRAMLLYAETETECILKGNEKFVWGTAKKNIDNQREKYSNMCESAHNARNSRYEINMKRSEIKNKILISEQEKDKDKDNTKKSYILSSLCSDKYSEKKRSALNEFVAHRKQMRKPMTDQAFRLLESKLNKLSDNEDEQIAILNQSILNGWAGVFHIDDRTDDKKHQSSNPFMDLLEELT